MNEHEMDYENEVTLSHQKLASAAESLKEWITEGTIRLNPCKTIEDTMFYRCRCAFQVVWIDSKFHFAIRIKQEPVVIDTFPVANHRIQTIMERLRKNLNEFPERFPTIRQHLTCVNISSAWKDSNDSDSLLTFSYDLPIVNVSSWKDEARCLNECLKVKQMSGRSRKKLVLAIDNSDTTIRDTLWLVKIREEWRVLLTDPSLLDVCKIASCVKTVHYEKPEGAFCHPNAATMQIALEWLIHRITYIQQHDGASNQRRRRLLELYCGCGAHTMALMCTGILESIVAVEQDDRLVSACKLNSNLNQTAEFFSTDATATRLHVIMADAGTWASKVDINSDKAKQMATDDFNLFDVLLVDPPRQGLDESVCRMANTGSFSDMLYISCGRNALIHDLQRLSCSFNVIDCMLLDLFPQTESVETLVHLRRKQEIQIN